jgi:hypothetical protein
MPYACELSQSFIKTLFQSDSTDDANLTPIRIEFHYTCGFYSKYIINKIFFLLNQKCVHYLITKHIYVYIK